MKKFYKNKYSVSLFFILSTFAVAGVTNALDKMSNDESVSADKNNKSTNVSENKQDITLSKIYDNQASKYSIKYPSEWIYDDSEKGAVVFSGKKNSIAYFTTINIQTVLSKKSGGEYTSVADIIADVKSQVLKESPQTTFTNNGSHAVSMKNGEELMGESITFIYSYQGHILQQWQIVVPRKDNLVFYTWAYTAPIEQYAKVLPLAKAMLSTWTIQ